MRNFFSSTKAVAMRLCMAIALLAANGIAAYADDTFTVDDLTYTVTDGTNVSLTDGTSATGDVTIPSTVTYDGTEYTVTTIDTAAFYYNTNITSVIVSEGITTIKGSAFRSCTAMTSASLPSTVTSIGISCFRACTSLTTGVIPENITYVPESMYYGCTGMTSVELPAGVTSISKRAFSSCSLITAISLPDSLQEIGAYAFYSCKGLTTLKLPDNVTYISNNAFQTCAGLTKIYLSKNLQYVDKYAFYFTPTADFDVYSYTENPPAQIGTTGSVWSTRALSTYGTLHLSEGCADNYTSNSNWNFTNISEDIATNSGSTSSELTYDLTIASLSEGASLTEDGTTEQIKLSTITLTFDSAVYVNPNAEVTIETTASDAGTLTATLSQNSDGDNTAIITVTGATVKGTYTITLAKGAIGDEAAYNTSFAYGSQLAETKIYYYLVPGASGGTISVSPEAGAVDELSSVKITFSDYTHVLPINIDSIYPYVTNSSGSIVATGSCTDENSNSLTITLSETLVSTGGYTLTIPAGTFYVEDANGVKYTYNDELTYSYTISAPDLTSTFTYTSMDPTPDISSEDYYTSVLHTIKVTFDEPAYPNPGTPSGFDAWILLFNYGGTAHDQISTGTITKDESDPNSVIITLADSITEYGTYRMYMAKGAIGDSVAYKYNFEGGNVTPAQQLYFGVGKFDIGTITITPEDGSTVECLDTFKITFEDQEGVMFTFEDMPYLINESGKKVYDWNCTADDISDLTCTLIMSEPITEEGTYTLVIPDTTFVFGSVMAYQGFNRELTFTYYIPAAGTASNPIAITTLPYTGTVPGDDTGSGVIYYYSVDVPEGDDMIMEVNATSDIKSSETYMYVYQESNSWNGQTATTSLSMEVSAGTTYIIQWISYEEDSIEFTVLLRSTQQGDYITDPIEAYIGENKLASSGTIYYIFNSTKDAKLIMDVSGTDILAMFPKGTGTYDGNYDATFVDSTYYELEVNESTSYLIKVMSGSTDDVFTLSYGEYGLGESKGTAIDVTPMENTTYVSTTDSLNPVWLQYTMQSDAILVISSDLTYDSSHEAYYYLPGSTTANKLRDNYLTGSYIYYVEAAGKTGETFYVYFNLSESALTAYNVTFTERAYEDGECASLAYELTVNETDTITTTFAASETKPVWFKVKLAAGDVTVTNSAYMTYYWYQGDEAAEADAEDTSVSLANTKVTYDDGTTAYVYTDSTTVSEQDWYYMKAYNSYSSTYIITVTGTEPTTDEESDGDEDGDDDEDDDIDTGINGIAADNNGIYNVYSISGMRVMRTENNSDLRTLPSGLYIINGKKVIVNKQ